MHAGALDYAMHNYAQLCTIMHNYAHLCKIMHDYAGCISTKTQGLQTRGNLGLRYPTNRQHSEICSSHSCLFWSETSLNITIAHKHQCCPTSSVVVVCLCATYWSGGCLQCFCARGLQVWHTHSTTLHRYAPHKSLLEIGVHVPVL